MIPVLNAPGNTKKFPAVIAIAIFCEMWKNLEVRAIQLTTNS